MPFYYLHKPEIKRDIALNSTYIYFSEENLPDGSPVTFKEEPNVAYCAHQTASITWTFGDDKIELIGHENHIRTKYKRVKSHKGVELWKNTKKVFG